MKILFSIAVLIFSFSSSYAFTVEEKFRDEKMEKTAQDLFEQVRCVVCSGQSIADSDAELAHSLRTLIRKKISEGYGKDEVLSYIAARYGDEILMKPPMRNDTLALWFGPLFFLILGMVIIFLYTKKHPQK